MIVTFTFAAVLLSVVMTGAWVLAADDRQFAVGLT